MTVITLQNRASLMMAQREKPGSAQIAASNRSEASNKTIRTNHDLPSRQHIACYRQEDDSSGKDIESPTHPRDRLDMDGHQGEDSRRNRCRLPRNSQLPAESKKTGNCHEVKHEV